MSVSQYEIVLSLDAKQDIYTTIIFLEHDKSKLAAENWKTRIITALESLSNMPHRCQRSFEEDIDGEIRSLLCRPHRIIFEISEKDKKVVILRVYHERREPLTLQDFRM